MIMLINLTYIFTTSYTITFPDREANKEVSRKDARFDAQIISDKEITEAEFIDALVEKVVYYVSPKEYYVVNIGETTVEVFNTRTRARLESYQFVGVCREVNKK